MSQAIIEQANNVATAMRDHARKIDAAAWKLDEALRHHRTAPDDKKPAALEAVAPALHAAFADLNQLTAEGNLLPGTLVRQNATF